MVPRKDLTGSVISHFEVLQKLGGGGMGVVYKARDTKLDRLVALKFLGEETPDERQKQRFLREAQAASRLDHPNICPTFAIDETQDGEVFIAMGYCDGESLRERLRRGPLSYTQAVEVARQVASGLVEAHARGVVHRDIKPSNIMFTSSGKVRIVDFGLAKMSESRDLTLGGAIVGTLAYMSPEQAQGDPAGQRSDIYSLGVVLFQMITGRLPYGEQGGAGFLDRLVNLPPLRLRELLPDAPAPLDNLIFRALAKHPDDRFPSAREMLAALDAVREHLPVSDGPTRITPEETLILPRPAASAAARASKRRRMWMAGAAAALLLIALFLVLTPLRTHLADLFRGGALPDSKHLAVIPFEVIAGDESSHSLAEGLAWQTAASLSSQDHPVETLWVIPITEVNERKIRSADQARHLLGANLVLTGSLQQSADDVVVTLVLIDARRLRQIRSATIRGWGSDGGRPLQDAVAWQAASLLQIRSASPARPEYVPTARAQEAYLLGRGYLQRYDQGDNLEKAIQQFELAAAADPRYALPLAALADAYSHKFRSLKDPGAVGKARDHLRKALALDPNLPDALLTRGRLAIDTGQYAAAIEELERLLQQNPGMTVARTQLAIAYERAQQSGRAEAMLREAIQRHPEDWVARKELGLLYYQLGKMPEAEQQFKDLLVLIPDSPYGYNALGGVYQKMGRYPEAAAMLEKSASIEPTYRAFSNLGTLYYFRRQYREAATAMEKALSIDSRNYKLWGNLAECYAAVPELRSKAPETFAKAVRMAQEVVAVNPRDADVRTSLAFYLARLGERDHAVRELSLAREGARENVQVLGRMGLVYEILGQREQAVQTLKTAVQRGYPLTDLRAMPDLAELRKSPAYRNIDPQGAGPAQGNPKLQ